MRLKGTPLPQYLLGTCERLNGVFNSGLSKRLPVVGTAVGVKVGRLQKRLWAVESEQKWLGRRGGRNPHPKRVTGGSGGAVGLGH